MKGKTITILNQAVSLPDFSNEQAAVYIVLCIQNWRTKQNISNRECLLKSDVEYQNTWNWLQK